ncbi:hypothetical protein [Candidatus Poriferisocius sp.]|uniref:hypothetical protein n=1 Tax=Candidatus Poriferisocius sp. TaxID=3101276 RepID=UPI003B01D0C9
MATDGAGEDSWVKEGLRKLEEGSQAVARAIQLNDGVSLPGVPEAKAREGLVVLRSALDWLEDTAHFDEAHKVLDDAGHQVRTTFGCNYAFYPDKGYLQECPVALAHLRVGFSVGCIVRESECSVCHEDPEDCDHISGQAYDGEVCIRIVKKADLFEVSMVDRPSQPDARITSLPVPQADLEQAILTGGYGSPASCDRCLYSCTGMTEFNLDGAESGS